MFFGEEELIKIAEITRTHGVEGDVLLSLNPDFDKNIITEDLPAFLIIDGMPVPFFIEKIKKLGNKIIAGFRHIETMEIAEKYVGLDIMTLKSLFEDFDEQEYSEELIGYSVFDEKSGFIGKVSLFNDIPGNPVIETEFQAKTIIIPYSEDIILKIDDKKKEIQISAPQGLIDLYLEP